MVEALKDNPYISFYGKHKISPVHQDLSDMKMHVARRARLYRSLGLPAIVFSGKRVLEIGPGGGYNSLVPIIWGARMDFVEPNPKAQRELTGLFSGRKIGKDKWRLFPCRIEDFNTDSRYEIVIAEGFIPGLYDRAKVILKLRELVAPGGVIVVTCIDEIGFLFELVKRSIGHKLIAKSNIQGFENKVALLSEAFGSHLKSLKFASRPVKDWVSDNFFNPAIYGKFFNISECINEFGADFEVLGTSPSIFTDTSWYKDTAFDKNASVIKQYAEKRHMLVWYKLDESTRPARANNMLAKRIAEFRAICKTTEYEPDDNNMKKAVSKLKDIAVLVRDLGADVTSRIDEGIRLLQASSLTKEKISVSKKLASAFGRGQQYISLINEKTHNA